jgi:hypothetical protein
MSPGTKLTLLGGGALALLMAAILLLGLAVADDPALASSGGVDPSRIPPLARQLLGLIQRQTATECPELPPVWVVAEVMAESSWNPLAWLDDANGGTAGLYQLSQPNWIAAGGRAWGVPPHVPPPPGADVDDPATHLTIGIRFACTNLRAATRHLQATGKPDALLDGMLVCHIAGCQRVAGSASGVPRVGEAGCDARCVALITNYLAAVHSFVTAFSAPTGSPGQAGPVPPGVSIASFPAPAPYTGPATGCTIDDPTSGGCLTGATAHALAQVARAFGAIRGGPIIQATTCWDPHPQNPDSDHPKGRACDFTPGVAGQFATGAALLHGWELAAWLRAYAGPLHVHYLIWQGRIWFAGEGDQGGWGQPYNGGGVYDPHSVTGGHYDHLHASLTD